METFIALVVIGAAVTYFIKRGIDEKKNSNGSGSGAVPPNTDSEVNHK